MSASSQRNSRKRYVFLALACLSLFTWAALVTEFHKWGARWGGIHVVIIAVVAAAVMGIWLVRRRWFTKRNRSTDWRFMIIPAVAFVLCAGAGILFTEPARGRSNAASDTRTSEHQSDSGQSSAGDGYFFASILDLGSSAADADVDEGCLLVLLAVLAIALIFGSLFIPHFWVLATFLMTAAMALFTYREWQMVAPDAER